MGNVLDLTGRKYGRLSVIRYSHNNEHNLRMWLCRCKCGREVTRYSGELNSGKAKSCGCLNSERARQFCLGRKTHGMSKTPTFQCWASMLARCYSEKETSYKNYGARGISVCDSWRMGFANFLTDMGERPSRTHSIERIDNNGNYEPGNCRWATPAEQARNRRSNIWITYLGETKCANDWARLLGMERTLIESRFHKGWPPEKIFFAEKWHGNTAKARDNKANRIITIDGISRCLEEWIEITGIPRSTVRSRLYKHGWSVERAITTPPAKRIWKAKQHG